MKNLDFKRIIYLIRLLMAEQKTRLYLSPLVLSCFFTIVGWVMNPQHLEDAIQISTSSIIGIIFICPVMIFLSPFVKDKTNSTKLLIPASALEKYLSIWGAGLSLAFLWLVTIPVFMKMFWMIIGTFAYDTAIEEVGRLYMSSFHVSPSLFVISLICTTGFTFSTIVYQLKTRLYYLISICSFCVLVGWSILLSILSEGGEKAGEIALIINAVLVLFITIGSVIWAYFLFKKIEFNTK